MIDLLYVVGQRWKCQWNYFECAISLLYAVAENSKWWEPSSKTQSHLSSLWERTPETKVWWCWETMLHFNFPQSKMNLVLDASSLWSTLFFLPLFYFFSLHPQQSSLLSYCLSSVCAVAVRESSGRKLSFWPVGRFYFRLSWHESCCFFFFVVVVEVACSLLSGEDDCVTMRPAFLLTHGSIFGLICSYKLVCLIKSLWCLILIIYYV